MQASTKTVLTGENVTVSVLGGFSLSTGSRAHVPVPNRKACGILAYLAMDETGSVSRERLAGLFWSDRSEEQARGSLRQCLKQLRAAFTDAGFKGFETGRHNITLDKTSILVDLEQVAADLGAGTVSPVLVGENGAPERILYGFEALDPLFANWLAVTRRNWTEHLVDQLVLLMRGRSVDDAKLAAQAIVKMDPTHEEAHRYLIRRHADSGNTAAALRQYKNLWDLLDEEYDMEPDEETQQLIAEIKVGSYSKDTTENLGSVRASPGADPLSQDQGPQTSVSAAGNRAPVIGISDFSPSGPWKREQYFVEGFRQELIAALIRFREWIIVETNTAPAVSSPATEHGIDYQLEGTYYEGGDHIRCIVTLKEVASGRYIWSESHNLGLTEWHSTQQSIVRRIAVAMNVYLSAAKLSQNLLHPGFSEEDYHLWLTGNELTLNWDPDDEARAEEVFKEIIRRSPEFAPAYSSLASIVNSRHFLAPGTFRRPELANEAYGFAKRSVEIDPLDTRNQLSLAWSNARRGRHDQAQVHFSISHDLNPNSPQTLVPCAHGFSFCGDHQKARQLADQAIDLNPMMPSYHWGYLMCVRYLDGDYTASVDAGERAGDVITDLIGWRAAALGKLGKKKDATRAGEEFVEAIRSEWHGENAGTSEEIVSWFLHCFPIKAAGDLENLREGLREAGLPVSD